MRTPASIAGHPIHPMLVPIALGCWIFSFAADLIMLATGNANPWSTLAYYTMIGGILGALAAAVPGLVDLLSLPAGYTKSIAVKHMSINLLVVGIYIFNAWTRAGAQPGASKLPLILSVVTILMLLVSGWLGGKMVYEAGVGVDTSAK
jgi:uncharacterized membrane protein